MYRNENLLTIFCEPEFDFASIDFISFRGEMAKRKIDCNLDDVVLNYFKRAKYEKTSKMFPAGEGKSVASKILKEFMRFLKENDKVKKENRADDDLGFEINFGAYQPEPRLQLKRIFDFKRKKNKTGDKKEKTEIPKTFIEKIKSLGLREKDADVLYKSKIEWTAIYLGGISNCCPLGTDHSLSNLG